MKPRIRPTECARWRCDGEGVVGVGLTPPEAYRAWLSGLALARGWGWGWSAPQRLTAIGAV